MRMLSPQKYTKKPVTVDAMQFDGSTQSAHQICKWMGVDPAVAFHGRGEGLMLRIVTPEGIMTAAQGDYVIRGIKGEFYPCKPDIFAATYGGTPARRAKLDVVAVEGSEKRDDPHFVRIRYGNGVKATHSPPYSSYWKALRAARAMQEALQNSEVTDDGAAAPRQRKRGA